MTPEQRLRQQEHAKEVRKRSEWRSLTPDQKKDQQLSAEIRAIAQQEARNVLSNFQLQGGNCINVSGGGTARTINYVPVTATSSQPKDGGGDGFALVPNLNAYDTDGSLLHTGIQTWNIPIDDATPNTTTPVYWFKTEFCDGATTKHAFILRSVLV